VPYFFGSTTSLTAIYPEDTNIPSDKRICGEQRAIMVDYFDGKMIDYDDLTPAVAAKALRGLEEIHALSICHGDMYESQCTLMRNVMVSVSGDVKWIDFEHSMIDAAEEIIKEEQAVAQALWGLDGTVWPEMYVLVVFNEEILLIIL
jgi:RIO-like serine/threonine protein kinase